MHHTRISVNFEVSRQFATLVQGHGYLSYPPARNINDTCKQCLSAGSPFWHLAPFSPGLCGNSIKDPIQNWNVPGEPQVTYKEGQVFDIAVVLTAQHMGYFTLELCDTVDITPQCFTPLMRAGCQDAKNADCYRAWKPLTQLETQTYAATSLGYDGPIVPGSTINIVVFKSRWQLPQGVTCSNCVLRWRYEGTNSCEPTNPSNDPSMVSEEFFNCADITIVSEIPRQTKITGPAADALKQELLHRGPFDLRPLGLAWQCPERAVGPPEAYSPATSGTCFAIGLDGVCDIQ